VNSRDPDSRAEGWSGPEELRARLAAEGAPLVGPVEDGWCDVTFAAADPEGAPGTTYRLRTLVDRALPGELTMSPVPGSDLHVLTLRLPAALRVGYALERHAADGTSSLGRDPFNAPGPLADRRLDGSVAVLPEAEPLPMLDRAAQLDPAPPEEVLLRSAELDAERRVWVSPPAEEVDGPLPVVIVFDGTPEHSAPAVRDALLAEGRIEPVVVVLVDQGERRELDLPGSLPFSRFLVHELLPFLRERHRVSADPAQVVLSGSSYGGLCSGWTALHFPEAVGGAILQSASCWYHPELPRLPGARASDLAAAPTPLLISAAEQLPAAPVRIYQEVGALEFGPPPAQVGQTPANRWLRSVLQAKGYDTVYREFVGGHDAAWWRGTWADALEWMLPSTGAGPGGA
jgi:enterochelin esterase family protein